MVRVDGWPAVDRGPSNSLAGRTLMVAPGIRLGDRAVACAVFGIFCCTVPAGAASFQEIRPVTADAPAADIADSERAFDRLDAESGLRSGGPFPFDYQHLVFFPSSDTDGFHYGVDLWTAASVQADRVKGVFEGGWRYSLDMTVELFQADTLAYRGEARTALTIGAPLPPEDAVELGFPIQVGLRVEPGEYDYRIRIKDNGWEGDRSTNEKVGRLQVPEPVMGQPFISSIAIAADSGGTWRPAGGASLQLNAARIVYSDARPFVYFEAYGLTPGGDYRGEVRLVSRRVTRSADDVFDGAYQPFQLQYRGSIPANPREPVRKVLRLDLGQTRPGPYEVQIRVRDLVTGAASEVRSARLKVRPSGTHEPLLPVASNGDD